MTTLSCTALLLANAATAAALRLAPHREHCDNPAVSHKSRHASPLPPAATTSPGEITSKNHLPNSRLTSLSFWRPNPSSRKSRHAPSHSHRPGPVSPPPASHRHLQASGPAPFSRDRTTSLASTSGAGDRLPCLFCARLHGSTRLGADQALFSDGLCQSLAGRIRANLTAAFTAVGGEVDAFTASCDGAATDNIRVCALARPPAPAAGGGGGGGGGVPAAAAEALVSEWLHELLAGSFRCAGAGDEYGLVGVLGGPESCVYGSYAVRVACG